MADIGKYVHRQRLCDKLSQSTEKIIFLFAKMGFGKTRLVKDWLQTGERPYRWLTLEEEDQNWPVVKAKLDDFIAGREEVSPLTIVIDDFYRMGDAGATAMTDYFLKAPQEVRFVVLSRRELPQSMMGLALRDQIRIMDEKDLFFTTEETQERLALDGIEATPEEAAELCAYTSGWAMALAAVIHEIRDTGGRLRAEPDYPIAERMVFNAVEQEVLESWPVLLQQDFLLMSLYRDLDEGLAEALTGKADAVAFMEELCCRGSFMRRTMNGSYRIHYYMYEMSEAFRSRRVAPEEIDAAMRRAGHYFEEKGDVMAALEAYYRRNLFDDGVTLLRRVLAGHPATPMYYRIEPYMVKTPEAILVADPLLCCGMALIHSLNYRVEAARLWYARLVEIREDHPSREMDAIMAYANIVIPIVYDDMHMPEMLLALAGVRLRPFKGKKGAREEEAWPHEPEPAFSKDGHFYEITVTGGQPRIMAGSRDFCRWTRHPMILKTLLEKPLYKILGKKAVGLPEIGLAECNYQKNQMNAALRWVSQGLAACGKDGDLEILFAGKAVLIQIYRVMDRKAEARSLTAELVKQLKEQDDGEMYKNAQAFQAIQYLCDGKKDDAMRWLLSREPEEEPAFRVIDRYYYLVKIRVLLACGQPEGALPLIELVGGYSRDYHRTYNVIEALILKGLALEGMDEKEAACAALEDALTMARSFGFIRVLADEGAQLLPVLERMEAQGGHKGDGFFAKVLEETRRFASLGAARTSRRKEGGSGEMDTLTPAEMGVLRLIATGRTNAEIAEELDIKLATVKTHINRIYQKLGVRNRTQALIEAGKRKLVEDGDK